MAERAAPRSTQGTGRPRRFVLPAEEDARTTEAIEGFLNGQRPRRRGPSPAVLALRGRGSPLVRPDPLSALETRLDWLEALAREEARHARYRRPVTIVVFELRFLGGPGAGGTAMLVRDFLTVLRRETRVTDRIARLGPTRFVVLLPETTELQASHLIERLRAQTAAWATDDRRVRVRAGWASPRRGETLREATAKAEERLAD